MPKSTERKAAGCSARGESSYLSADERRAKGKALRDPVPRESQAGWKPPKGRRDPVAIVSAANAGRLAQLVPIRFGRMSASAFALYRGSAVLMAADLARPRPAVSGSRRAATRP